MSRKRTIRIGALGIVLVTAYGVYRATRESSAVQVISQPISRGDIEETVGSTGTLEAVTTVQVGTQVSGTIQELRADFNTPVRKGQMIAKLDPSLFQTQVDQARANLDRSEADLDRLRLAEADSRTRMERARSLAASGIIAASDLDTAETVYTTASAQVRSAIAQVTQARASLNQAMVSLEKTVIAAPINGIVIARNVDVGQTVAASFQAPTLFVIAADLTRMRVNASIHEADIGRIRPGQEVRFRVDAYPDSEFPGTVSLVRLNPVIQQNVVTYATVIDVPNPDLRLKPGMTATVTIQVAKRENVLLIPAVALRFRPTAEVLAALGQAALPKSPSEKRNAPATKSKGAAELFGPLSIPETAGRVWQFIDGKLVETNALVGITDGTYAELRSSELPEGTEVVTSALLNNETPTAASKTSNPLLPQRPPGGGKGSR
jgi:HlyD family secretion protein